MLNSIATNPLTQKALTWVEHALVVAGVAALGDLGNNVANLGLSGVAALVVSGIIGAALRWLNKKES